MPWISVERVCQELGIDARQLDEWSEQGLIELTPSGGRPGLAGDQAGKLWSLVSLQRDLDVNLEGAAIILELSEKIRQLQVALLTLERRRASGQRWEEFRRRTLIEQFGEVDWDVELS